MKHPLPHNAAWLELTSPAISSLVALELLAQARALGLSQDVQATLAKALQAIDDSDMALPPILGRLGVFANTQSLEVLAAHQSCVRWREAAMAYLIMRQVHFPLLRRLFNANRAEVARVRQATQAPALPLRHEEIPLPTLRRIWQEWAAVQADYATEAEQWVMLAQRWSDYPLATLYQALVLDAAEQARPVAAASAANEARP